MPKFYDFEGRNKGRKKAIPRSPIVYIGNPRIVKHL